MLARLVAVSSVLVLAGSLRAAEPADSPEFFEKRIRPLVTEHCFKCHGDTKGKEPKGGLRLDSRAAMLKGGDNGTALVPGEPDKSRIMEAVRYQNTDLQMPPKGKLADAEINDLAAWVKAGAVWPNDSGTTATSSSFDLAKRKREHWAWQPVRPTDPPAVRDTSWPAGPVDRFILAKLEEKGLKPAAAAARRAWIRRVTFDLVGLPPTPAQINAFLEDESPDARAKVVDRLLASPHFGERWGRHWLDLVRYAETRGHEFDPIIPNAFEYRDYVIRAWNADVPYDQFVREHVAGDLVAKPRFHPTQKFNESILGTGFWFLGEEVHSPVDIRQDQADRFDNRIDVLTKTFLGLTVSCARCHDHKFDAISTKDYYALYGFVESSAYRQVRFETLEQNRQVADNLAELNREFSRRIASALAAVAEPALPRLTKSDVSHPGAKGRPTPPSAPTDIVIDYSTCTSSEWRTDEGGFGNGPTRPGRLIVTDRGVRFADYCAAEFDRAWDELLTPAGTELDRGAIGKRVRAGRTISTPNFRVASGKVHYLVRGAGTAYAAVAGHTLIEGPLHGQLVVNFAVKDGFQWVTHDLSAYQGQPVHVEFTAANKSDFAVAKVVQCDQVPPIPADDANEIVDAGLRDAIARLRDGPPATIADARIANSLLERLGASEELSAQCERFIAARNELLRDTQPTSRLAPAMWDGNGVDENVFVRGSPKAPGERVPRRFLEALAGTKPIHSTGSGRLELAHQMTDPAINPFVARVFVNRIWHHLFGRGLVGSVDNFGLLGELPTHPELLDFLADRFVRDGWSTKRLIRDLVLSSTYAMSTQGDPAAGQLDPQNLLLSRARLRRLEGEAIRDAMLAVSCRLNDKLFGPSVPIYLTPFLEGRGRPASGPLDGDGRRSIYLSVKRNFLSPMLLAFDTPIPFSTVGRRQVSNVPAQALILLNDPFVHDQAKTWAKLVLSRSGSTAQKIHGMYIEAFGRPPSPDELEACVEFLNEQGTRHGSPESPKAWVDLAHTLFNTKDFLYVN